MIGKRMRPNLSYANIAAALAALAITDCRTKPNAAPTPARPEPTASAVAPPPPPEASASAVERARPGAAAPSPSAAPSGGKREGHMTGQSSCGAGNCGSDPKKK